MNDQKIIYSMVGVTKAHSHKTVIKDISLSYFYGAKIGVLGLNGSGKSTLLRIMAGVDKEFGGESHLSEGYTVGFLQQEPELDENKTVIEVVKEAVSETVSLIEEYEHINQKFLQEMTPEEMEEVLKRQAEVGDLLDKHDAWTLEDRLSFAMAALNCPPKDQPIKELSGGEKRRVALCRLLLEKPDILLLDEPTNHLDAASVHWLEKHLQEYKGTVIAVTHDRYFLDNVAGWILELDRGHGIPWKGNYSSWLEQKTKRLDNEKKTDDKRKKTLERELDWIRMSPKARHAKNKARISAYEKMVNQPQGDLEKSLQIYIPPGPRLGDVVIKTENLSKKFGDKDLYGDLNIEIPPGAVVGIVGPNGTGKTTLFNMIMDLEKPDCGEITIGSTVKLGYMEQSRLSLSDNKSVYELVSGGSEIVQLGKMEVNARAYVSRFNFNGPDQQKLIKDLSGGERNRVQLSLLLKSEANVLLLDEPTNDLDVNTLRALEEAIVGFAGSVLIISHDRWFLDRVCTHTLGLSEEASPYWFDGTYTDFEQDFQKRTGKEVDAHKKVRHASLSRN